jgi:hypothetical protein
LKTVLTEIPSREQIAEALWRASDHWTAHEWPLRKIKTTEAWQTYLRQADAVLALFAPKETLSVCDFCGGDPMTDDDWHKHMETVHNAPPRPLAHSEDLKMYLHSEGLDPEMARALDEDARKLESMGMDAGATIKDIRLRYSDAKVGDVVECWNDDTGDEWGPCTLVKSYRRKGNAKGWMAKWWVGRDEAKGYEWRFTEECIYVLNGVEIQ